MARCRIDTERAPHRRGWKAGGAHPRCPEGSGSDFMTPGPLSACRRKPRQHGQGSRRRHGAGSNAVPRHPCPSRRSQVARLPSRFSLPDSSKHGPGATCHAISSTCVGRSLSSSSPRGGGWSARPELAIDADARHSRSIDVHLGRRSDTEQAVVELEDLLNDGGAAFRNLADKVAAIRRASPPGTHVQGLLILRSTARNRSTLAEFPGLFRTRFPGSSQGWLRALIDTTAPLPDNDGLLWSTSRGDRLVAVRGLVEPGPRT